MVFPLSDDNSDRRTFPLVTVVFIAVNVLVFVLFQGMGNNNDFTLAYATVPAEIVTGHDVETEDEIVSLPHVGRIQKPGLRQTPIPVYLTVLTAMFMHGGWAHLLGNMWFLWVFGDNIEQDMGKSRYPIFYVVCGILASLTHVVMNGSQTSSGYWTASLGASGAISGVMGAYMLLHPQRRVTVLLFRFVTQVPGFVAVGLWFAFQVVSSMMTAGAPGGGGVAFGAHIGGFIAGLLLAKPFLLGIAPNQSG